MQNNCIKRLGTWKAEVKLTIMFCLLLRFVPRPLVNLIEDSITVMEPICSFSKLAKSSCGEFRKSPNIVPKLLECKDDIAGHLQARLLSRLVGKIQEYELILVTRHILRN